LGSCGSTRSPDSVEGGEEGAFALLLMGLLPALPSHDRCWCCGEIPVPSGSLPAASLMTIDAGREIATLGPDVGPTELCGDLGLGGPASDERR
jgi:hypothetical protein